LTQNTPYATRKSQLCPSIAEADANCPLHPPVNTLESTPKKGLQPFRNPSTQVFSATNILVNLYPLPTFAYSISTELPGLVLSTSALKLKASSKLSSHLPMICSNST